MDTKSTLELKLREKNLTSQLWCDNLVTISNVNSNGLHEGTKHIDLKYRYMDECVETNRIKVDYINTKENIADIFIKPLDRRIRTLY